MLPIASCHISWNWWSAWLFGWLVDRFAAQSYSTGRKQTCGLRSGQAMPGCKVNHIPRARV